MKLCLQNAFKCTKQEDMAGLHINDEADKNSFMKGLKRENKERMILTMKRVKYK